MTNPGRPALDDTEKKRHQWLLRLNDRKNDILVAYMAEERIEEKAWLIQACIAYTMAHCPAGQLEAEMTRLRGTNLLPPGR